MNYEQMKAGVKEIAEIASAVPECFREKCFELLLSNFLNQECGRKPLKPEPTPPETPPSTKVPTGGASAPIPVRTQLRLLMKKTGITMEDLEKILLFDNGEVHFVREPHDTGITTGQIEWTLLLALKNAIVKDALSSDPEEVRSVCQEKGFYDKANFAAAFRAARNAKLFKSPLVPQGAAQPLSSDGQDALGALIKRLAGEN
jgi:hypothetical protein